MLLTLETPLNKLGISYKVVTIETRNKRENSKIFVNYFSNLFDYLNR